MNDMMFDLSSCRFDYKDRTMVLGIAMVLDVDDDKIDECDCD